MTPNQWSEVNDAAATIALIPAYGLLILIGRYVSTQQTPRATLNKVLEALKEAETLVRDLEDGEIIEMIITAQDPFFLRKTKDELLGYKIGARALKERFSQASFVEYYAPIFSNLKSEAQVLLLEIEHFNKDTLKTSNSLTPKDVLDRITARLRVNVVGEKEAIILEELRNFHQSQSQTSHWAANDQSGVHPGLAVSPTRGQAIQHSPSLSSVNSAFSEANGIPLTNTTRGLYNLSNGHV